MPGGGLAAFGGGLADARELDAAAGEMRSRYLARIRQRAGAFAAGTLPPGAVRGRRPQPDAAEVERLFAEAMIEGAR